MILGLVQLFIPSFGLCEFDGKIIPTQFNLDHIQLLFDSFPSFCLTVCTKFLLESNPPPLTPLLVVVTSGDFFVYLPKWDKNKCSIFINLLSVYMNEFCRPVLVLVFVLYVIYQTKKGELNLINANSKSFVFI